MWSSHILWKADEISPIIRELVCSPSKSVALVIGEGFDPRMNDFLVLLHACDCRSVEAHCLQIGREGEDASDVLLDKVRKNRSEMEALLSSEATINYVDVRFEEADRNSTAPAASDKAIEFAREMEVPEGGSVVVDISALPQGLYFPILEVFIRQRFDEFRSKSASLYVFVSESPDIDEGITALELQEDAYLVPPFRSAFTGTDDRRPVIWFPVLGEGEAKQIERIEKLLPSQVEVEICPVLPMPAADPRRADNLIREYGELLQDSWSVDARSFIYSAEQNPFHLYERLTQAAIRYVEALSSLGGCRAIISSHSSKLLSLGALLAASELNSRDLDIGFANVDATWYNVDVDQTEEATRTHFLIPLLGDVFES